MTHLKAAVVGAGYFAQLHHEAWSRMKRAALVGICDVNAEAADAAAEAHNVAAFGDLSDMLEKTQPDLVDIVTPPASHLPLIRTCMDHAVPVIAVVDTNHTNFVPVGFGSADPGIQDDSLVPA